MPTVELYSSVTGASQSNWRYALAFNSAGGSGTKTQQLLVNGNNTCAIYIYSNAIPVPSGYVSGATLATYTPLISILGAVGSGGIYSSSQSTTLATSSATGATIINTEYVTASASGTASWFLLGNFNASVSQTMQQIIGTVGAPGSGADLIIGSTSIVAGSQYKASLSILFPLSWSW